MVVYLQPVTAQTSNPTRPQTAMRETQGIGAQCHHDTYPLPVQAQLPLTKGFGRLPYHTTQFPNPTD
jgi:hypothetical protein